jgi:Ni/Co efflux regulator RcnB
MFDRGDTLLVFAADCERALGLIAPPANFQWVRYGPDLMLVNILTGNVVDIQYGVFG